MHEPSDRNCFLSIADLSETHCDISTYDVFASDKQAMQPNFLACKTP